MKNLFKKISSLIYESDAKEECFTKNTVQSTVTDQQNGILVKAPYDDLLPFAISTVMETGQASSSMLEKRMHINYLRASKLIENMESLGIISPMVDNKPRKILISNLEEIRYEENKELPIIPNDKPINFVNNSLLECIDKMDGHSFEHWCAALLLKNGFSSEEVTPGSGDHGVDIVAEKDQVHYAIQCKCYHSDLGNTPVQEVYAGKEMYGCQVGVVMTNRNFTKGAKELAKKTRVLLWDREKINAMIESAKQDF